MSITSKTTLALTLALTLFVAVEHGFRERLERQERSARVVEDLDTSVRQANVVLRGELQELEWSGRYLAWTGVPELLREPEFVSSIVGGGALVIQDQDGQRIASVHNEPGDGEPDAFEALVEVLQGGSMLGAGDNSRAVTGVLTTPKGVLLATSHAISLADAYDSPKGRLILAQPLQLRTIQPLERHFDVTLTIEPQAAESEPGRVASRLMKTTAEGHDAFLVARTTRVVPPLWESYFEPEFLLRFGAGLVMVIVFMSILHASVIRPIITLTKCASRMGKEEGEEGFRLDTERKDEIGALAAELDRMKSTLQHSHSELVKSARLAGMSEIATGALHNINNVLNSVNVSTSVAMRNAEKLAVSNLEALLPVIEEYKEDLASFVSDDPRGKHLAPFLQELTRVLADQRDSIVDELKSAESGLEHIRQLIVKQQSYAGKKGAAQSFKVTDVLDEGIDFVWKTGPAEAEIEILREYEDLPRVDLDRHKLTEILVNLIGNARHALEASLTRNKKLWVRAYSVDEGMLAIEVEDNGVGIAKENLTKIFNHGFTTKKDGHGFGLHACSNSAKEMNAFLSVRSDGAGKGAKFILHVPVTSKARAEARAKARRTGLPRRRMQSK